MYLCHCISVSFMRVCVFSSENKLRPVDKFLSPPVVNILVFELQRTRRWPRRRYRVAVSAATAATAVAAAAAAALSRLWLARARRGESSTAPGPVIHRKRALPSFGRGVKGVNDSSTTGWGRYVRFILYYRTVHFAFTLRWVKTREFRNPS